MGHSNLSVPARLLVDQHLRSTTRLLWMIRALCAPSDEAPIPPGLLQARSGLARHTVLRGLGALESAGWLSGTPAPSNAGPAGHASLPVDLLLQTQVGVQAKLIYGALQLLPSFRDQSGQFTHAALSDLIGLSLMPVRAAVRELEQHGWLQITQRTKFDPIHFTLCTPVAEGRAGDVAAVESRLAEANYKGEAIMQEYLSLIVASDEFEDHARPGFLLNPYTGERMEFDRYYPPKVAFEFNGDQHYGPTERYPSKVKAWKQEGRDLMKIGICVRRGIRLITVHGEDLSLAALRQKVEGLLPLRNLDRCEALIALLEEAGRGYRRAPRSSSHRSSGRHRG